MAAHLEYPQKAVVSLPITAGAWGLLPFAIPATVFVAVRLGSLAFPAAESSAAQRAVGGAILTIALIVAIVSSLGAVHLFTPTAAALSLLAVCVALAFVRRERRFVFSFRALLAKESAPMLVLACAALGIAVLAARWMPVWQWDALGYHLPYVNFFLLGRGFSGVPSDLRYISTYPHNVELFTVALRALLPDDRLIDLAQIPLGIVGAIATAGIARLYGAERAHALAAGCAWILIPAGFLQLPTNYVDVGSAAFLLAAIYFVLSRPTPRTLLAAGVALGLYLGSKANAPMGTALLGALLVVRGARAKLAIPTLVALLVAFAFGAGSYMDNWTRHGNPTWPVKLALGPLHLPGTMQMNDILVTALNAPQTHGPLYLRILKSWTALRSTPAFDMRVGGYGPIFLVALPFAIVTLVRARSLASAAALAVTLATLDPSVARWILAFPAMVLALAAPRLASLRSGARAAALGACAILGVFQLAGAYPGLAGEGPPLAAYASMSDEERERAVGANGDPAPFIDVRKRVGDGETFAFAFDLDDELPYLAWERDLRYHVLPIPQDMPYEQAEDFLNRGNVRVFMVRNNAALGLWGKEHPDRATPLFSDKSMTWTIYERR